MRWRRGYFHVHVHEHEHDGVRHLHTHVHEHRRDAHPAEHRHAHAEALGRSPLAAFGIGLIHGLGGSAAVAVLVLGAIRERGLAALALAVFAAWSAPFPSSPRSVL